MLGNASSSCVSNTFLPSPCPISDSHTVASYHHSLLISSFEYNNISRLIIKEACDLYIIKIVNDNNVYLLQSMMIIINKTNNRQHNTSQYTIINKNNNIFLFFLFIIIILLLLFQKIILLLFIHSY